MKDISEKDRENNLPLVTRREGVKEVYIGKTLVTRGGQPIVIAGPCTIESRTQINEIAQAVKEAGADMLRGGVFKPLTFPYGDPLCKPDTDTEAYTRGEFNAREVLPIAERIKRAEVRFAYFKEAADKYGLPIVSEITNAPAVSMMERYVDAFQIGYRHMFNMDLIEALSQTTKPLILKRHAGQSLRDLLGVCEHFEARGKTNYAVCERGVIAPSTHDPNARFISDIQAIPALHEYAPTVPVFFDPSHATFNRSYVMPMARAAVAAGADGLLIETHPDPEKAWVDPLQALNFSDLRRLVDQVKEISRILR